MAKISFIKDEENKIIIRKIVGEITIQETIDTFETMVDMIKDGFNAVGIVNDITEGKLNIKPKDIPKLVTYLRQNIDIFSKVRLAACVTSPASIIIPILVSRQVTKANIKAFSTMDAAYDWVLSFE